MRHDWELHAPEGRRNQARTDNPGRLAAAELQYLAAKSRGDQADGQEVPRQIDHVAEIISVADAAQRLVQHVAQVGGRQVERAAYAQVEVAILGDRRKHDAGLDDRFYDQEVRVLTELLDQRGLQRGIAPDRF